MILQRDADPFMLGRRDLFCRVRHARSICWDLVHTSVIQPDADSFSGRPLRMVLQALGLTVFRGVGDGMVDEPPVIVFQAENFRNQEVKLACELARDRYRYVPVCAVTGVLPRPYLPLDPDAHGFDDVRGILQAVGIGFITLLES